MKCFDLKNSKEESLNDKRIIKELDKKSYRQYQIDNLVESIIPDSLEEVFTDKVFYNAMKKLSHIEKRILFLSICEERTLNEISRTLLISKKNVRRIKSRAIARFKKNVEICRKNSNKGGDINE